MKQIDNITSPLSSLKWVATFASIGFLFILFGSILDEKTLLKKIIDLLAGAFFVVGVMEFGIKAHLEKIVKRKEEEGRRQHAKLEEDWIKMSTLVDDLAKWGKQQHKEGQTQLIELKLTKIDDGISELKKNQRNIIKMLQRK